MYIVEPSISWALTLGLPSIFPGIPVSPVADTWTYKSPRLQSHSCCWYRPHRHRAGQDFPGPNSRPCCALTPRDS